MSPELKTLIDVSGKNRLPQYEEEIFSDNMTALYYIDTLCLGEEWHIPDDIGALPLSCYCYADAVMRCHWPAAEVIISRNAISAALYALYVLHSRFQMAEDVISKSHNFSYIRKYNLEFGTSL